MNAPSATPSNKASAASRQTHAERREKAESEMLRAALRIVAEKGLAGLQLNDVGEAAGYSRGLPAHYFGKKDALVARLADFVVERFQKEMRRTTGEMDRKGLDAVLIPADFYLRSVAKHPDNARALLTLLSEATYQADLLSAIIELNRGSINLYAQRIRRGQEDGGIRPDIDPETEAHIVLAQLRGAATLWLTDRDNIDIDQLRKTLKASLTRSLKV